MEGVQQWPFRAVGDALEVIPRTLAQNCGANVVRALTTLRVGTLGALYHEKRVIPKEFQQKRVERWAR